MEKEKMMKLNMQTPIAMRIRVSLFSSLVAATTLIALPTLAIAQPETDEGVAQPDAAELPAAKSLFEKHIEAIGGEKALRKYKSQTVTGSFQAPMAPMPFQLKIQSASPNQMLLTITIAPGMEVKQGFDGTVGWMIDPYSQVELFESERLDSLRYQADFYADLNYAKHFSSIETVGLVDYEDKKCFKVHCVTSKKEESDRYFDEETGRLYGLESSMDGALSRTTFAEYKDFGGIFQTVKTIIAMPQGTQEFTVSSVTYDDVDEATFVLPISVQAKVDEAKAQEGETNEEKSGG